MPTKEAFVPGHMPSARVRDRTIDVDSVELEVIDARPRGTRRWIAFGTLLAASVVLVTGSAALLLLDETDFGSSAAAPVSPRAPVPSLPSLASPEAESASGVVQPVELATAEPNTPRAQEDAAASVSEVAQEAAKPVRKRSQTRRTRAVTSASSRTVTKRIQRQ